MSATLAQLLCVQSRLAEEATRFLERIEEAADSTPWEFAGRPLKASSAFVEPVVFTWREPGGEREREGGRKRESDGAAKGLSPTDELMLKQYERERHAGKNEEKRWHQVVREGGRLRLIVTGEPGSGKSCTTSHTVARLARESADALRTHARDVNDVTLPIPVIAADLLRQPARRGVADAVLGALEAQPKLAGAVTPYPRLREWLRRHVLGPNAFIVVDALDELRDTQDAAARCFGGRLGELGQSQASLVVTCRTLPWKRLKQQQLVPWQDVRHTVELKPLDDRPQRDYAEAFFAFIEKSALGADLDERLYRSLSLREHCRTPLILTFASGLLADGRLPDDASIVMLYNQVVTRLLEGAWRHVTTLPKWTKNKVKRERVRLFLGPLGWQLFHRAPATNRFTLAVWDEDWTTAVALVKAPPTDTDALLEDLVRIGLLVEGGIDESGEECWSFAHRTVLEFLAAVGLNKDEAKLRWLLKVQKPIEDNPFWFHPEFLPTLTFLAAIMGDATPLIEAVDIPPLIEGKPAPGDDFFRHMFGLKCRFAGAAPNTPAALIASLAEEWLRIRGERQFEWSKRPKAALDGYGHLLARYGFHNVFGAIMEALSVLGDHDTVAPLMEWLRSEQSYARRGEISDSLWEICQREACFIPRLS